VRSISISVPSISEGYEGMTPAIKVVLNLPGKNVTLAKLIEGFRKDSLIYVAANVENGLDIVPLFRDGNDPLETLEKKMFPVLKRKEPINSSASNLLKMIHAAKEKRYQNIYDQEINMFSKWQWVIVDKIDIAMKLMWGQCTPALQQSVRSIHDYNKHEGDVEWLLLRLTKANSGINRKQN